MDIKFDNTDKTFKPTVEWMSMRYQEMNKLLFNNFLGACHLDIFTTGKGSEGRTLGYFQMKGNNLKYNRNTRQMYILTMFGDKEEIDQYNFFDLCKPLIAINGNYSGTEYAFLCTLVHEMCHYYTYMYGYVPKQAHGRLFREVSLEVSLRSNGIFSVQRLASAEEMSQRELNDEMKEKRLKRTQNKASSLSAVFQYQKNGVIYMTTTNSESLINEIVRGMYKRPQVEKVVIVKNPSLFEVLFDEGYKKNMRTWRYWDVTGKEWLKMLDDMKKETIYNPLDINKIRNESINRRSYDDIITEVINRFITEREDNNEMCDIVPGVNLGLASPFEMN